MWAVILLTVVISVTARPEEKFQPQSPRQVQQQQQQPTDRETRSFSSFPREGSDAIENIKDENNKKKETEENVKEINEEIPVKLLYDEENNNKNQENEELEEKSSRIYQETSNKLNNRERNSRIDDINFKQNDEGVHEEIENNSTKLENDSNNNNNKQPETWVQQSESNLQKNSEFSNPLIHDDRLDFNSYPPALPEYNNYEKLKINDQQSLKYNNNNNNNNIETEIKNQFFNELLQNNYGGYLESNIESKNMNINPLPFYPDNYPYNNIQPMNFDPSLKDIFNYNPIFDYIKKSDSDNIRNSDNDYNNNNNNFDQIPTNSYIKRKIQHYQTVYRPNPSMYFINRNLLTNNNLNTLGLNNNQLNQQQQQQQQLDNILKYYQMYQQYSHNQQGKQKQQIKDKLSSEISTNDLKQNLPPIIPPLTPVLNDLNNNNNNINNNQLQRIYDDYFPIVIQNPFNAMWTAFTNIVEYGPEADVCKNKRRKNNNKRRGRDILKEDSDDNDDNIEILDGEDVTREFLLDDSRTPTTESAPYIRRLKVRRGGVAIAGPGGIATAGSGGTAIVGPGGTAYTKQDGTAIVGPGGRLVHVPEFFTFPFFKHSTSSNEDAARTFKDPPGSKFIAMGPLIYYNLPSETSE